VSEKKSNVLCKINVIFLEICESEKKISFATTTKLFLEIDNFAWEIEKFPGENT